MKLLKSVLSVLSISVLFLFSAPCVAKSSHLFNAFLDDEDENSSEILKKDTLCHPRGFNSDALSYSSFDNNKNLQKEVEQQVLTAGETESELLRLLFDDAVTIELMFPNKTEKYYRGQIEKEGFEYINNSRFDSAITSDLIETMVVDPEDLTDQEKEYLKAYYRLIQQKYESPWYMKYISKKVGYGVFAAAPIKKGQLIAEYAGIIYDKKTYLNKVPYNANYCWNMTSHSSAAPETLFYVDAIKSCNVTRFINHSYTPNVMPLPLYTPEGYRMLYVACEDIEQDEQLLVNYGSGYWAQRSDHQELSR